MSTTSPARVVVADDSAMMRAIVSNSLKASGVQVVGSASNGDEALALCERERPDAMTLDLAMPGLDGIGVLRALRTRSDAPHGVATQLITDVQNIARKRRVKTLTFLLPLNDNRAIAQAKSWGFQEFRIMPEAGRMLAFFRKSVD